MAWEIFELVASRYETWYGSAKERRVDRAERALLDWNSWRTRDVPWPKRSASPEKA